MKVNEKIELKIEDMLDDGRAFGRAGSFAVFVSGGCETADGGTLYGAVPGDLVRTEITKIKKNSAEAKLLEVIEPSPDRVESECPYFGECGGCTMQELSYEAQLRIKREQVVSKLQRIGGVDFGRTVNVGGTEIIPRVCEMTAAESFKYYRNKAVFSVGPHGEVGFKKAKSDHVIDIDDCMLQSDAAMVCADALRAFLKDRGRTSLGIDKMTVRTAFGTGEVMVILEADSKTIPQIEKLISMFDDAVYSLNSGTDNDTLYDLSVKTDKNIESTPIDAKLLHKDVSKTVDGDAEDRVESQDLIYSLESVALVHKGKCRIVAGKATITDEFFTGSGSIVKYEISPQSFFQVNPEQMVKLYNKAAEYAFSSASSSEDPDRREPSPNKLMILDLYCGAGTIGIWLLDRLRQSDTAALGCTQVIGIESVKSAVLDANRNSVINGLVNTRYFCGKAEEELPGMMGLAKLYKWNEVNERVEREPEISINKADVALLDPPRAGCAEALLEAVVKAAPNRIVYVSCDPGTLARDVKYLRANGYEFIEAAPIDQFPWTSETEVASLMVKK